MVCPPSGGGSCARLVVVALPGRDGDDEVVTDWVAVATGLVVGHPAVDRVEFAGSRSRGTHHDLSDWDFAVETSDFESLAADLPGLVAPLSPLSQQWEPMGTFPVYQVLLPGLTKIEYLFLDRSQEPRPPLRPDRDTLAAINTHFWDWIWWIATKGAAGRPALVAEHLARMQAQILAPMGISTAPTSIGAAVEVFVQRRDALEAELGLTVDRRLEREVRQGIDRLHLQESSQFPR